MLQADTNHHLQNRNLACYHYTMEQSPVAPEGVEPSLTEPKPVVLPLYHRAISSICGTSWNRTTFSGFSVLRIHQVCQSSECRCPRWTRTTTCRSRICRADHYTMGQHSGSHASFMISVAKVAWENEAFFRSDFF